MHSPWHTNPFLRAAMLAWARRMRRAPARIVLGAIFGIAAIATLVLWQRERVEFWAGAAATNGVWVMLLAAMYAGMQIARTRRELAQRLSVSWLAATPLGAHTLLPGIAMFTLGSILLHLLLALAFVLLVQLLLPSPRLFTDLVPFIAAGTAAGAALGWRGGHTRTKPSLPASRYVPGAARRTQGFSISLAELARWPISQTFAWARPAHLRWPLFLVLLSPSAGTSIGTGLAIIAAWTLVMYMSALFRATLIVARAASAWLRPTPLGFARFALAVGLRSLVHQLLAGALLTALLVAGGSPVEEALNALFTWISFVALCYGLALALGYHADRSALLERFYTRMGLSQ